MPKELIDTCYPVSQKLSPAVRLGWSGEAEYVQMTVVNAALDPDGQDDGVLHVQLNRHSINRMIRVLRRARDASFGADA
jgi:hypothetical protein